MAPLLMLVAADVRLEQPVSVIALGAADAEHLTIQIEERVDAGRDCEWDGGWMAGVAISAGPWSGTTRVPLRAEQLFDFGRQLAQLCDSHEGFAVLRSTGDRLFVRLSVDGLGRVLVHGHITDKASPVVANALAFALSPLDPDVLTRAAQQVRAAEMELGVRADIDSAVEVRSRFDGTWVPGFEIAEILHLDDDPLVRLRRSCDGAVLPRLFAPEEVRAHHIRPASGDLAAIEVPERYQHRAKIGAPV
jgi:hypothetical protein